MIYPGEILIDRAGEDIKCIHEITNFSEYYKGIRIKMISFFNREHEKC